MAYQLSDFETNISDSFFSIYEVCDEFDLKLKKSPVLSYKNSRRCRFCTKKYPTVTFDNTPHQFSKFLCNPFLTWNEECDRCNKIFSAYEREMSVWLGAKRIFSDIKPGDNKYLFENGEILGRRIGEVIFFGQTNPGGIMADQETGAIAINTTPPPYIPAYVYNALLKNALSALPKGEVIKNRPVFLLLLNDVLAKQCEGFRAVYIAECNRDIMSGRALMYKRKVENAIYPNYMFCLYANNIMFQIPIIPEGVSFPREPIQFSILPASYLTKGAEGDETLEIVRTTLPLEGWSKIEPEREALIFRPDPEAMKNLVAVPMKGDIMATIRAFDEVAARRTKTVKNSNKKQKRDEDKMPNG